MSVDVVEQRNRALRLPSMVLLVGAALVLIGQLLGILPARANDAPLDAFVQVVPWLLLMLVAVLAGFASTRLALALLAGGVTFGLRFAGQLVIDRLPLSTMPHVVWIDLERARLEPPDWLLAILDGKTGLLTAGGVVVILGALVLITAAIVAVWALRPLLLGPASRASFGIDLTVLLTLFTIACLFATRVSQYGGLGWQLGDATQYFDTYYQYVNIRTFAWLVPLVLWLALACRQGGALAVGAGMGLVLAVGVVPWLLDAVSSAMGGPTSYYSFGGANDTVGLEGFQPVKASEILDPLGTSAWLVVPALLILVVALWWALGTHSEGSPQQAVGGTTSPVNVLSVVSFVMAFIPLMAIAAIILGHMAYDNIIDSEVPQRGIGLSRWAIVLGYLTTSAGGVFILYQALA